MVEGGPSILLEEIPVDLYALEILPHLPARHIQTLKTVCKDWLQLINSAYFVRRHLSVANQNRIRVLVTYSSSKVSEYTNYYQRPMPIPYPPQFSNLTTNIAGSADGLICLLHQTLGNHREGRGGYCIAAIFNPSTGESFGLNIWRFIEYSSIFLYFWWFGKHPSGEYVLVLGTFSKAKVLTFQVNKFTRTGLKCIHSVSINAQHLILSYRPSPLEQRGTFAQGIVYWPIEHHQHHFAFTIFAYHLDKNTCSEISPPAQCRFRLGVVDGCLFATLKNMQQGVFELWMRKESRWTKNSNIDIEGFHNFRVLSPLGIFPNGDMVLDVGKSKLIKYSFNHNEAMLLMKYDSRRHEVIMCADTLVSPDIWEV